jgi:hypothetical protein
VSRIWNSSRGTVEALTAAAAMRVQKRAVSFMMKDELYIETRYLIEVDG